MFRKDRKGIGCMIVMIYGVERSGKTTLIEQLLNTYENVSCHVKRSVLMNSLALINFSKPYDGKLSKSELDFLYDESQRIIFEMNKQYKYIFMDCHAGYYTEDKKIMDYRRDEHHLIGDLYFYLYTSANVIVNRMKETNGVKAIYNYQSSDIENYQELELKRIKKILEQKGKEVFIVGKYKNALSEVINVIKTVVEENLE